MDKTSHFFCGPVRGFFHQVLRRGGLLCQRAHPSSLTNQSSSRPTQASSSFPSNDHSCSACALHPSSKGTSVPQQHLQVPAQGPPAASWKGEQRTQASLQKEAEGPGLGGLGPSLSIEEGAELLGLGQRHTCRVNRKPTSQTLLSREAGVGCTAEEGEGNKRFDKRAGLTLTPVPPLESLRVKEANLSALLCRACLPTPSTSFPYHPPAETFLRGRETPPK